MYDNITRYLFILYFSPLFLGSFVLPLYNINERTVTCMKQFVSALICLLLTACVSQEQANVKNKQYSPAYAGVY